MYQIVSITHVDEPTDQASGKGVIAGWLQRGPNPVLTPGNSLHGSLKTLGLLLYYFLFPFFHQLLFIRTQ